MQIASISKTVTGVCAMRLVERGLLALDDDIGPLTERVGDFSVRNPRHPDAAITLRMLLSMSSSITDSAVYSNSYTAGDSQWSLARFCREYFAPDGCFFSATANYGEAEPGASFAYSNVGAGLVGFLVEAASGQPFADFAEENVLGPLGMTSCADHPRSWSAPSLTPLLCCVVRRFCGPGSRPRALTSTAWPCPTAGSPPTKPPREVTTSRMASTAVLQSATGSCGRRWETWPSTSSCW